MEFGQRNSGFFSSQSAYVACQVVTCNIECGVIKLGAGTCSTYRCCVNNLSSGDYSAALGGCFNCAQAVYSTIPGGCCNQIPSSGCCSVINGGSCNTLSGYGSVIGGGSCNVASGCYSIVTGGFKNTVSGTYSTVSGYFNTVSGNYSVISGGYCNINAGNSSGILGGTLNNMCSFSCSFIIGTGICATQACTTFMNCASVENLTIGCMVCVGANKTLVNATGGFASLKPLIGIVDGGGGTDPVSGISTFSHPSLIGLGASNGGKITIMLDGINQTNYGINRSFTYTSVSGTIDLDYAGSGNTFQAGSGLQVDLNQ